MDTLRIEQSLPRMGLRGFVRRFVALQVILVCARAVFAQSASITATSPAQQAATTQSSAAAEQFASISGHILRADTSGPLAKAIVTLDKVGVYPSERQVRRTGPDGAYKFDMLDAGGYQLTATAVGFVPAAYAQGQAKPFIAPNQESVHVAAGQTLSKIDLSLESCAATKCAPNPPDMSIHPVPKNAWVISGVLVDANGDPLDGEIQAVGKKPSPIAEQAFTDAQGRFQIAGTETKDIRLAITAIGLEGSAYVTEYYPGALSPDDAQVFKVAPGSAFRDIRAVFKTVPVHTVIGKVQLTDTGAAAQRYVVRLTGGSMPRFARTQMGEGLFVVRLDKTFTIRGLQPGNYTLTVRAANRGILNGAVYYNEDFARPRLGMADVDLTNSDVSVSIPIGGPVEIDGHVTVEGEPDTYVVGPTIGLGLNRFANLAGVRGGQVINGGDFKITGVAPGQYTLALYDAFIIPRRASFPPTSEPVYMKHVDCGGVDYTDKPFTIEPGVPLGECNVVLAKNPGVLTGVVYDGDKPATDAAVMLIPQSAELQSDPTRTLTNPVDANGRYEIRNIPSGDYLLFAVARDQADPYRALDLAAQNAAKSVRITIRQSETATEDLKELPLK